MRYAYLKQNNAVQELKRVSQASDTLPEGGPDAYVAHFLHVIGKNPALLLSMQSDFPNGESAHIGNVDAKTFYWFSKLFRKFERISHNPLFTIWPRFTAGLKIFISLVRFRPNVILCWANLFPLWAAYLVALLYSSHFVYCRHTRLELSNESWIKRISRVIDIWIMQHADKVIVHGPYLKEQALKFGIQPDQIIEFNWSFRNMPEIRNSKVKDVSSDLSEKLILFIGRLESYKGIFDLLDACDERLKSGSDAKLAYAGDGVDYERLSQQITKRGLIDKVTLLGKILHENLAGLISESTVVVTPTRKEFPEGRCMATMEGLVMGKPVVAPNFGPFPYLVQHCVNGLLYEPDSVKDLQKNIFRLLDDSMFYNKLCEGAENTSKALRTQGPNFSEALFIAFNID